MAGVTANIDKARGLLIDVVEADARPAAALGAAALAAAAALLLAGMMILGPGLALDQASVGVQARPF